MQMQEGRITGMKAVEYAEEHGRLLCKYADPIDMTDSRNDLTPAEARKIVSEDPEMIYLDVTR